MSFFFTVILRRMWTEWVAASRQDTLVRTHTFAQSASHGLPIPSRPQTFLPAQFFKIINLHPPIFLSPSMSPYSPSTLSLWFLSLVHRRLAITSLWPKCVTALSLWLPASLPPPALSLYPFLSVWTSIKFFSHFFPPTIYTHFEKHNAFWPVLQMLTSILSVCLCDVLAYSFI